MKTKPMYVGRKEFASYKEAAEFCQERGLSRTLIHDKPLGLSKYGL